MCGGTVFCIRTIPVVGAGLTIEDTDEEETVDRGRNDLSGPSDDVAGLLPAAFDDNCRGVEFCIELISVLDPDWAIEETEDDEGIDRGRADPASPPDELAGTRLNGSKDLKGSSPISCVNSGDGVPSCLADSGRGGKGGAISAGGEGVVLINLRFESDLGLVNLCQRDGVGVGGTGVTGAGFDTDSFSLSRAPCGVVGGLARGLIGTGDLGVADGLHFRMFGSIGERGGRGSSSRGNTGDSFGGASIDTGGVYGLSLARTSNFLELVPGASFAKSVADPNGSSIGTSWFSVTMR
jgi:hypothetical protein